MNPTASLTEMQRHLRGEPEKFGCLGGHKYFHPDAKLDLCRCHFWETPNSRVCSGARQLLAVRRWRLFNAPPGVGGAAADGVRPACGLNAM